MLKRFYSKRSGFTLVEIIVAFAVFAIMASMIAQILSLSISARNSNNQYARELARQEKMLTVVQKDGNLYTKVETPGDPDIYKFNFTKDGTPLDPVALGFQVMAADPAAENQAEGINYFLSPVDYECKNDGSAVGDSDPLEETGPSDGMGQTSRVDTRISGTKGISSITVYNVIKDTNVYPPTSDFYLKPGQTRYFIEVAASTVDEESNTTFQSEDVPFAQYRLFFYSPDELDGSKCTSGKDAEDREYTKNVYKEIPVLKCGLINEKPLDSVLASGLSDSNTSLGSETNTQNLYTVQSLGGNSVRIGTPFTEKEGKQGVKFQGSKFTRFYVDFDGDPKLTPASFGHNGVKNADGSVTYSSCPMYEDEYNDDGTPTYTKKGDEYKHPSIYGAYMFTRKYKDASDTPDE